jgi:hypothetical protein
VVVEQPLEPRDLVDGLQVHRCGEDTAEPCAGAGADQHARAGTALRQSRQHLQCAHLVRQAGPTGVEHQSHPRRDVRLCPSRRLHPASWTVPAEDLPVRGNTMSSGARAENG